MSFVVLLVIGIEKLITSLFGKKEEDPSWA